MSFYLGIDGGGTKTKFVLGDEERVLAEAVSSGSNILRSGEAPVRDALQTGVQEVCAAAGLAPSAISHTVAGIAGSSKQTVHDALVSMLCEISGGAITVVGDMEIAHYAALAGAPGILVNAGTGSIAYGRNERGETARAGGWGYEISDEGSGHWIGRVAVAAAMRRHDRGEEHGFLHHLMAALGATEPTDLARIATADLANVFPAVVSIAQLGDAAAQTILRNAGEELAGLAETVWARLFAEVPDVFVAAAGGVFSSSAIVFEHFQGRLQEKHRETKSWVSTEDAAMGALRMAREQRS